MTLGTIIVAAVITGIVAAVITNKIKRKKKGKTSCDYGCRGCPLYGSCHPVSKSEFRDNNSLAEK